MMWPVWAPSFLRRSHGCGGSRSWPRPTGSPIGEPRWWSGNASRVGSRCRPSRAHPIPRRPFGVHERPCRATWSTASPDSWPSSGEKRREYALTLVQLDSNDPYKVINGAVPIGKVRDGTPQQYRPCGASPLLDAVGSLVRRPMRVWLVSDTRKT